MKENSSGIREVDLRDFIREIFSHWRMMVLCMLAVSLAGGIYAGFLQKMVYENTTIVYVLNRTPDGVLYADMDVSENLAKDYKEIITSRPVLSRVLERMELDMTYEQLYKKVDVTRPDSTRILYITARADTPLEAKDLSDTIAEVFEDYIDPIDYEGAVNIMDNDYLETRPVSMSVKKAAALGGAAGGLVSFVFFVLRFFMLPVREEEREQGEE